MIKAEYIVATIVVIGLMLLVAFLSQYIPLAVQAILDF